MVQLLTFYKFFIILYWYCQGDDTEKRRNRDDVRTLRRLGKLPKQARRRHPCTTQRGAERGKDGWSKAEHLTTRTG